MHVISYRILREYTASHADCREAIDNWYKVASKADWSNLIDVQSVFPKAEAVSNFTVFNIKGNKYRLIVSIDYKKQLIYIKYILTHAEYDKEEWKNDPYF
ncbi:type II toxin-antitoxin system HigB family toxin [Calothrix sp. FACHB-156]|nr:type II toxin-antitoxin system HigB family toxin [Calothrix sp. FACHB-156]